MSYPLPGSIAWKHCKQAEEIIRLSQARKRLNKPTAPKPSPEPGLTRHYSATPQQETNTPESMIDTGGDGESIFNASGQVRPEVATSLGFVYEGQRGTIVIPWPSLSIWLKVKKLKMARDAYLLKMQYNAAIISQATGQDGAPDPAPLGSLSVSLWNESEVRFDVIDRRQVDHNIIYSLLWPLHKWYLEERIEQAIFKRRLKKKLRRAGKWEEAMLIRRVNPEEGGWVYSLLEKGETDTFVDTVIPAIDKYFESKPSKKKLILP